MKVVYREREYEIPGFDTLSFKETDRIKLLTRLRPGEWSDAFAQGDPMMNLGVLVTALSRAGVDYDEEELMNSNAFETVRFKKEPEDVRAELAAAKAAGDTEKIAAAKAELRAMGATIDPPAEAGAEEKTPPAEKRKSGGA